MTEETYARLTAPWRAHPQAARALLIANKILTYVGYVAYPLLLALLALDALGGASILDVSNSSAALGPWAAFARCVIVPAVAFAAVSLFRRAANAPRPYEKLNITPLINKDTRGKSFPSRHTFSMFTIAAAWWQFAPAIGGVLMAAGTLMAAIRVVGGVHFPRDVIAGALSALAISALGYALVP